MPSASPPLPFESCKAPLLQTFSRVLQQIIRHYGWIPKALWQSAFLCGHPNALPGEGKSFCPDCGDGIVYRWHVMRCAGCNARREARYCLRHWIPSHAFCQYCGENGFREETVDNARYHQLHKAYLTAIPAKEFEQQFHSQWPKPTQAFSFEMPGAKPRQPLALTAR